MKAPKLLGLVLLPLAALCGIHGQTITRAVLPQAVQAPMLKWPHGGWHRSWCETAWCASPAVAHLDIDRAMEVIGCAYSRLILHGATRAPEQGIDTPGGQIWPGVAVADVQGDGDVESVIAH